MTPDHLVFLALAGLMAGAVNAIAGGGSLLSFPALLAVGLPPVSANVTNTVGLLPGYLGGTIGYRRELTGQGPRARTLTFAALLGAGAGCILLLLTPASIFERVVPFLVLGACALLAVQPRLSGWIQRRRGDELSLNGAKALWLGVFLAAAYGAYFGAALGVLLLGLLGVLLEDHIQRLNALKGYLSLVVTVLAALVFAVFGPVSWVAAAMVAASSLVGGHLGASLARRLSSKVLRLVVLAVGVSLSAVLFVGS